MAWRNSPERWGAVAQLLHWTIAVMVVSLVIVGLAMDEMRNSPTKLEVYALHKSFGLTVLALVAVRLVWRLVDRRPPYPASMPRWQQALASLTHGLLYVMLFVMPLSGWLYNSASNFPLRWFGLFPVPALTAPDRELKHFAGDVHETGWQILALLFAAHLGAALWHHFVHRDATLTRMLPGRRAVSTDETR